MKKIIAWGLCICLLLILVGCDTAQTTSTPEQFRAKVDRDFVYDWLVENGELINGKELVYALSDNDGNTLDIVTNAHKEIIVTYQFVSKVGYTISCQTELFQEGQDEFECKLVDATETGASYSYKFDRATFTDNTPIAWEEPLENFIDGESVGSITKWEGKKPFIIDHMDENGFFVTEDVPEDKYETIKAIKEYFSMFAQKILCRTLDALDNGFCSAMGITIHDLGYEKFEGVTYEIAENPQSGSLGYGYTDM